MISVRDIFRSVRANYAFAVLVWGVSVFFFLALFAIIGAGGWSLFVCSALAGGLVAFGHRIVVPLQKRAKITTVFGTETEVWAAPGKYFGFWIFGTYEEEVQEEERFDVKVGDQNDFFISDRNGKKLQAKIDADYAIGDTDEARNRYEAMREDQFPGNLKTLLERAAVRVFGVKEYWSEIIGKELSESLLEDSEVLAHSAKYGIVFTSMMVEVRSASQDQDDLNAQRRTLTAEYQALHPGMSDKEISELVEVQLGLASKFVSETPVQARFEIGESEGGRRPPRKK